MKRFRTILEGQNGDTLVEVVIALAILSSVLLGSTALTLNAYRSSQLARERTAVSNAAEQQMEAIRSFRDNHTWAEFRGGLSPYYPGVDALTSSPCHANSARRCFHMELANTTPGTREWVPVAGGMAGPVPTSVIELSLDTTSAAVAARPCNYDVVLDYSFKPMGAGPEQTNHIRTRLANLHYDPLALGSVTCL